MEIKYPFKGLTYKSCIVTGAENEDAALDFAMAHFGESKGRLFGWNVSFASSDTSITWAVTLHTD